jgi:hypothetical protein
MSLTRSQIQSWNPWTLKVIGDRWLNMGTRIEGAFDRYRSAVTNINDGHWEGVAAEAALHRADSDRRAAVRLVDRLERVAKIANDGLHAINAPLQRAREAIADAEGAGFRVSENLEVSKAGTVTPEQLQAKLQWQTRITDADLRLNPDGDPYLDGEGDPYLKVEGATDQATLRKFLGATPRDIDINPDAWVGKFSEGMTNNKDIVRAGRR